MKFTINNFHFVNNFLVYNMIYYFAVIVNV